MTSRRFMHVDFYKHDSLTLIALWLSLLWLHHNLCNHVPSVRYLGCSIVTTTHNGGGMPCPCLLVHACLSFSVVCPWMWDCGVLKYVCLQPWRRLSSLTVFATMYTSTCGTWEYRYMKIILIFISRISSEVKHLSWLLAMHLFSLCPFFLLGHVLIIWWNFLHILDDTS